MQNKYTRDTLAVQDSDSVTVLQCTGSHIANKTIFSNGEVRGFNAGKFFIPQTYPLSNIHDLADLIEALEKSPQHLVIRGQIKTPPEPGNNVCRQKIVFDEKPRHWLCIDTEVIQAPEGVSPISLGAVEHVISHLPPELHDVSVVAQFSNQAGTAKAGQTVRAHLWVWLDRPYGQKELDRWGRHWNEQSGLGDTFIDVTVFRTVQPSYTAAPTFEDPSQDPLPNGRTHLIVKGQDFATLKLPDVGWKPKAKGTKKQSSPRPTTVGVAGVEHHTSVDAAVDEDGRLTNEREDRAFKIRFSVFLKLQEAGPLTLELFTQESWAIFERECVTTETAESTNVYAYEDWVLRCERDFESLKSKFGVPEALEPYFKTSPVMPAEAQAQVASEVARFFTNGESSIIRITPGTGKTTTVAQQLPHHLPKGKVAHVFASTLDLGRAWEGLIEREKTGVRVRVIEGRNETNCKGFERADAAGKAGLSVTKTCCINEVDSFQAKWMVQRGLGNQLKEIPGKGLCSVCPFYEECVETGYQSQFKGDADVFIFASKQLSVPRRGEIPKADFVIVDEEFLSQLCELTKIEFRQWHTAVPDVLRKLIDGALAGGRPLLEVLRDADWNSDSLSAVISALNRAEKYQMRDMLPHQPVSDWEKGSRRAAVASAKLLKALQSELGLSRDRSNKVRLVNNDVHVCDLKDKGRMDAPTLILDGTGNAELIERVKPGVRMVQIDVERQARVVQVNTHRVGVGRFKDNMPDRDQEIALVQDLIDRFASSQQRVLLVTYKLIKGDLVLPEGWEIIHFGALRGSNRWTEVQAIFIVGNWNKPLYVAEDMAAALWGDSDEELTFADTPVQEWRGYRMAKGKGRQQVKVSVHPDRRVQLCLEQMREAEGVQAVDRARLIWGKEKKDVYIVSSLVLDITVDKVIHLDELAHGSLLEQVLRAWGGVIPLSKTLLCQLLPDLFSSESGGQRFINELREGFKGPNSNISTLLGFEPMKLTFRKSGQRGGRATECLYLPNHPSPRATLEKLVGRLESYDGPQDDVRPIKFLVEYADGRAPDPELLNWGKGIESTLTPTAIRYKPPRDWAMLGVEPPQPPTHNPPL